jgi:GNAT superfamily N-acetyltransferase
MSACTVRDFAAADADAVAHLLDQLGYPVAHVGIVIDRAQRLMSDPAHALLVAEWHHAVVGLLHLARVSLIASEGYVEVHALVVDEPARGHGVGAALLAAAEAWTRQHGGGRLRVRSGAHRERAHRFYAANGYPAVKLAKVFEKRVDPAPT